MKITLDISALRIAGLMTSALDQNNMTAAWCKGVYLESHGGGENYKGGGGYWYADPRLFTGRQKTKLRILVIDAEANTRNGEKRNNIVTLTRIHRGLQLMAEKHGSHFGDVLLNDYDNVTADVFLQCVALGEVRYG